MLLYTVPISGKFWPIWKISPLSPPNVAVDAQGVLAAYGQSFSFLNTQKKWKHTNVFTSISVQYNAISYNM